MILICRPQIKELLDFLGRYKLTRGKISVVRNKRLKKLIAETVSLEPCPACVNLQDSSNRALAYLLMGLSEPEIQKAYINSDGLCLPHLKQALDLAKGQTLAELISLQLPKLYLLRNQVPCQQDQLDLLTGKKIVPKVSIFTGLEDKEILSTTNNSPASGGSEQTAWLRAIELYANPNADESDADWISGWFNS